LFDFSKDTKKLRENVNMIESFSQIFEKSYTFEPHQKKKKT